MKNRSTLVYLFQILFVFLAVMIFWSARLVNKDLKVLSKTLTTIENKIQNISKQFANQGSSGEIYENQPIHNVSQPTQNPEIIGNPEKANLLSPDLYFTNVLPNLLPTGFSPHGTYSLMIVGKPDHLHPFGIFADVVGFYCMCVPSLAEPHKGQCEIFAPALADKIEEVIPEDDLDAREYHVYLRKDLYWAPLRREAFPSKMVLSHFFMRKHPVTAHDFKFRYDAIMNPHMVEGGAVAKRNYYSSVEFVKVIDDYTFVVRWKSQDTVDENGNAVKKIPYHAQDTTLGMKPLPRFVYQYFSDGTKIVEDDDDDDTYRKHSVWAQNFTHHWARQYIVSCGPWIFHSFSDETIEFVRNPHYFDQMQALTARRVYHIKDSPETAFQDFKVGKIDKITLPNNDTEMLKKFMQSTEYQTQEKRREGIRQVMSFQRGYTYVGWNMHTKFFESKKVRQAMCLAIDKEGIIRGILNNAGAIVSGPFPSESYAYDKSIKNWPFDLEEANRLLDEAGWVDLNGDGIRDKVIDGKRIPFRFKLCYFGQSQLVKSIVEHIAMSLKQVGVLCEPYGVGRTDLNAATEERTFDALLMGWQLGLAPPNPRLIWHSDGANQKGSLNFVGFVNKEADKLIELLSYETDKTRRQQFYHRLHRIIFEEAPYTFLTKRTVPYVYREYIKNVFVPSEHLDLIPGATDDQIDDDSVWIEKD